jgi:hypothetical protein
VTGDRFREHDAAYVLGALSMDERREFEAHLRACDSCSSAVRELAGVPGLLATVPLAVAELGPVGPVPETLLPSLVRMVRRQRSKQRWLVGMAAAAAAVSVGLGGVVLADRPGDITASHPTGSATASPISPTSPTAAPARSMKAMSRTPLAAQVSVNGVAWGTRLDLTCTYTIGDRGGYLGGDGPAYVLVVHAKDGKSEQVATWRAVPGRVMRLSGATQLSPSEIATVEVRTAGGTPLLALTI